MICASLLIVNISRVFLERESWSSDNFLRECKEWYTQFTNGNNLGLSQTTFIYKSFHTSPLTNSYYNTFPSLYSFTVFHSKVTFVKIKYNNDAKKINIKEYLQLSVKLKNRTSTLIIETALQGDRVAAIQHVCDAPNVGTALVWP